MERDLQMKELGNSDRRRLEAAQGWLELGNALEANQELERLAPALRGHPDVLAVRWQICAQLGKWEAALDAANARLRLESTRTEPWVQRSHTLKQLGRIEEARANLRRARKAREWGLGELYDLASQAAKLGDMQNALACLQAGVKQPGFARLRALALLDERFKEIRLRIRQLGTKR